MSARLLHARTRTGTKQSRESTALELEALEAELAGLPAAIDAAARDGDDAELSRLLIRERRLPILIRDRKADVMRRRIAEVEAEHAAAVAEKGRADEEERAAHEALRQARLAVPASERAYGAAFRHQEASAQRRDALAGQLAGLRAELAALGA